MFCRENLPDVVLYRVQAKSSTIVARLHTYVEYSTTTAVVVIYSNLCQSINNSVKFTGNRYIVTVS